MRPMLNKPQTRGLPKSLRLSGGLGIIVEGCFKNTEGNHCPSSGLKSAFTTSTDGVVGVVGYASTEKTAPGQR